jgi:release factor glutamine methyltransferase
MANKLQTIQEALLVSNSMVELSDSPQLDRQLLLAHCLGQTREWLLAHSDEEICIQHQIEFLELIERRQQGEPVAYLLGYRDFWNSRLKVTRDTLIPRPETELIIETILDNFDTKERLVVDLGTGSGAIAISLAMERPNWTVFGIEISYAALCIARQNGARQNGTSLENVFWFQGDWGNALQLNSIDLLVCNPPYIAENDNHLDALSFEPRGALVSENQGMRDLEKVISSARSILKDDGQILVEHGYDQQVQVCDLLKSADFDPSPLVDLEGNPRAVWSRQIQES